MIRTMKSTDIESVISLFREMLMYVANEKDNNADISINQEVEDYRTYLTKQLNSDSSIILVVDLDGLLAGYLSCDIYAADDYIYLDDFCVSKNYRRHGLGTELIKEAKNLALRENIGNIQLHVDKDNSKSIKFYENLGFQVIETTDNRYLMRKNITKKLGKIAL